MSLWMRAFLTRPFVGVDATSLGRALVDHDFAALADYHDLDVEAGDAAKRSLRYEVIEPRRRPPGRQGFLVHYNHHEAGDAWWMRLDLWSDPGDVNEEISELLDEGDLPPGVPARLAKVVASAAFELKGTDTLGMGLPIAFHTALWLGHPDRGDGIVEYEGTWWDPATKERVD